MIACEQALRSRMGRKESGKNKVGGGGGEKVGERGRREDPVDKGLKPPFRPLSINLSLICH